MRAEYTDIRFIKINVTIFELPAHVFFSTETPVAGNAFISTRNLSYLPVRRLNPEKSKVYFNSNAVGMAAAR